MDGGGQLAQRLRHQTGLGAHVGISHVALDLRLGDQGGNAVDDDSIYSSAAYQLFGNIQGLFSAVGLGYEQGVQVQPAVSGVCRVHGVLHIDVGSDTPGLLRLGHDVDGQGGLTRRLGPEDLGYSPLGDAPGTQGHVQGQGARGDDFGHQKLGDLAQAHDRTLAVVLFDVGQGDFQCRLLVFVRTICHRSSVLM